jgi:hypothetical protein
MDELLLIEGSDNIKEMKNKDSTKKIDMINYHKKTWNLSYQI